MIVKLLIEHHLEFLSLKGSCRGSSESTLVKMSNCWKSHAAAQFYDVTSGSDIMSSIKIYNTLVFTNLVTLSNDTCNINFYMAKFWCFHTKKCNSKVILVA